MKRILFSFLLIGIVGYWVFNWTSAFFSDRETSVGNTFAAGAIDLLIDNTSYYNGVFNSATSWQPANLDDGNGPSTDNTYRFFDFHDLKPSDRGEDTISIHVDDNDAWGCYEVTLTANDDNTCTEPELADDLTCVPDNNDLFDGELADAIQIAFWADDGDNVLEEGESVLVQGTVADALDGLSGALADSTGGILGLNGEPMIGAETYYVAKAWCFGELTLNAVTQDNLGAGQNNGPDVRNDGIDCDGSLLDNATQTDIVTGDISFTAVQARNNPDFTCGDTELVCREEVTYTASVDSNDQGTLANGGAITDVNRIDPAKANGAPNWTPGTGTNFYSLGFNTTPEEGWVVLKFDGPVGDGAGVDLKVYEATNGRTTYPAETARVEISDDGTNWHEVGTASSEPGVGGDGVSEFDVSGTGLTTFQYVRLTDTSVAAQHDPTADGFDLDAVEAVYGACEEVED